MHSAYWDKFRTVLLIIIAQAYVLFFAARFCERRTHEAYIQGAIDTARGRLIVRKVWRQGWKWNISTNEESSAVGR